MHKGYWPKLVDHIDRDIANNNIDNLRDASGRLNSRNSDKFKNFIYKRTNRLRDRYEVRVEGNYVGSSKCPLIAYRMSIDAPFGVNFCGI